MDDGSPIGLILVFVLCLACSFYFSGTEMAFTTVNRIRMRNYADNGNKRARRVLSILDDFDRALTTILIGNNIVNLTAATVATIVATRLWGAASVTVVTLVTTFLVFLLAETLPKTFAKACNEQYAMAVAGSLQFLMKALRPLVFVFSKVTDLANRPFRGRTPSPTVTEEELRDIIGDAVEDGALDEETGVLVQSAIQYTDAVALDLLTPWQEVLTLRADTPHEEVLAIIKQARHSRLPVVDASGRPIGLLRARKYLKATLRGKAPATAQGMMDPIDSVGAQTPVDDLLPAMSHHKTHFALVTGDAGQVLGIITIEDMLERLVGDIWDEDDVEGGQAHAR